MLAATLLLMARPVRAEAGANDEAREAYAQGAAAYEAGDFARAVMLLADADARVPNPVVLHLALASALQTDDPVIAMRLVLRAEARAVDGSLADMAREGRARFAGRVGVVQVVCHPAPCRARVDEQTLQHGERAPVLPGLVTATFDRPEPARRARVEVRAGAVIALNEPPRLAAPPPPEHRAQPSDRGLHPAFFWSGVAVTAVLGGFTVASALDTAALHDDFMTTGPRTIDGRERGERAETRTNVLLGVTALSAVATGVVGLLLTRWSAAPRADVGRARAPHAVR